MNTVPNRPHLEFVCYDDENRHVIPIDTTGEIIEPIDLPHSMDPAINRRLDLQYDADVLAELESMGFNRVGAGVLAYDRDRSTGGLDFLIGLQRPSAKNPRPVWSLPSETTQYGFATSGNLRIESAMQTAVRCLVEELNMTNTPIVHTKVFPWLPTVWPIGSAEGEQRRIIAPVIPLAIPFVLREIVDAFQPNEELQAVKVVPIEDLLDLQQEGVRRGYIGALGQMMLAGTIAGLRRGSGSFLADSNLTPVTENSTSGQIDKLIDITSIAAIMAARAACNVTEWHDLILPTLLEQLRERKYPYHAPLRQEPSSSGSRQDSCRP